MSSSTKNQSFDGYITEYANSHNISSLEVVQTAIAKEVIKSFEESKQAEKGEKLWNSY